MFTKSSSYWSSSHVLVSLFCLSRSRYSNIGLPRQKCPYGLPLFTISLFFLSTISSCYCMASCLGNFNSSGNLKRDSLAGLLAFLNRESKRNIIDEKKGPSFDRPFSIQFSLSVSVVLNAICEDNHFICQYFNNTSGDIQSLC